MPSTIAERDPAQESGYERRIGRYGEALADAFVAAAGVRRGDRVLDVGCGTGALTARLVATGAGHVAAIDPVAADVTMCAARVPAATAVVGRAEELPYADDEFDAALAQLVVSHMDDPPRGVGEMRRVTRPGGAIAVNVWDFAEGMTALRRFWDAAAIVAPAAAAEYDQGASHRYRSRGDLEELLETAEVGAIESGELVVSAEYADFADYWEPLLVPDGTPGRFLATLDEAERVAIHDELRARVGDPRGPFRLDARAWYARGAA